jgi:Na+-transporting methylmalonyl-CoA/oxaloacetate decarboxylase gamma subunit
MALLSIDWAGAFRLVGFSFSMVFVMLILIVFVLAGFAWLIARVERVQKEKRVAVPPDLPAEEQSAAEGPTDEEVAAICMALRASGEAYHDRESNVITIERVSKRYTPWSSKIFGLNGFPRR